MPPSGKEPDIHDGLPTSWLVGPKIVRIACCRMSDTPQVASSVSSGRPYRKRITPRSMTKPTKPVTRKATGSAIASDQSNRLGAFSRITSCTMKVE
ncbi:hypothetical protein D3C71_460890 [compost metagenome]